MLDGLDLYNYSFTLEKMRHVSFIDRKMKGPLYYVLKNFNKKQFIILKRVIMTLLDFYYGYSAGEREKKKNFPK